MKKHPSKRLLCLVLTLVLCLGLAAPAGAADNDTGKTSGVKFEQVDNDVISADLSGRQVAEDLNEAPEYKPTDMVRVSILLDAPSTIELGFSTNNLAENTQAMTYRHSLQSVQTALAKDISAEILGGQELDVVWNLTLAANLISANVQYGKLEEIKVMDGVAGVILETQYAPAVAEKGTVDPNMSTSSDMIGSGAAWATGYTGVGSKIAIIDTGTDTDHQSFDAGAFEYAIEQTGKNVDLMDASDIAPVLSELNIASLVQDANSLYLNAKLPFAFNYVDKGLDVTHDNDSQGEHGSHVAGIAAANRYIPNGDGTYSEALTSVYTQGVAPDAQIITMKVFGKKGGAYDSDYMAAIEDAIMLGADSINLSLGSGNPGFSSYLSSDNEDLYYQGIMDSLVFSDAVVCISAGNAGTWQEQTTYGYLYNDGVSMQTDGSPGSYTNAFTVASVDNTGSTGSFLDFQYDGLHTVSFAETSYKNAPITSLDTNSGSGSGTDYDFVLFNSIGVTYADDDEKQEYPISLLTDYAKVCKDKVVMVFRGTSSFIEKHEAVDAVGGAACIVMNNQPGIINMDLTKSVATIPCVSIPQADALGIMAAATPVTDEGGNVLYYTGKVTISSAIKAVQSSPDYYTMSSFSSWGVPGSLELKPEITAPGGNIYSVFGSNKDSDDNVFGGSDKYENMSGTSMASPQMAGMAAVMAQYLREKLSLEKGYGTYRNLSQSLLMSTAEPIIEADTGNYYSVLNQGAGLANVNAAINAHSYIRMDEDANAGATDGKVKVELGDDPGRKGSYSFSYTLYNLTDEAAEYTFDTDVFTQDVFSQSGISFLDTWTRTLDGAKVTYQVSGQSGSSGVFIGGRNAAQRVLNYITGGSELTDAEKSLYDLDQDGQLTSYDAHLLLNATVSVPADGSVDVTVTIDVTGCDFSDYPAGAYIEAYSYATEASTPEGEEGTVHSIPVLGYYGSWTDPSMYDVGTLAEYWYDEEERFPYLVKETELFTNYLTVKYPGDNSEHYFFGNPLTDDDEYLPERNAFNSDSTINKYYATIIRNAAASKVEITDVNTGAVYYSEELGSVYGAYYYTNGSAWRNTQSSVTVGWQGTDAQGNKLPEDTEVNISLILAPEYYVSEAGTDWDALGDGACMTTRTAIDNTAPTMTKLVYNAEAKTLTATASDNRYLATVALYENGVARELDFVAPNQALEAKGKADDYTLNIPVNSTGTEFYIQLTDYAMNQTTYKFVIEDGEISDEKVNPTSITLPETAAVVKGTSIILTPAFAPFLAKEEVTWTSADENIATVDENGKVTGVEAGITTITVTSAYDEDISATCSVTVKTYDVTLNGMLQDENGNPQLFTWNLANDKTWKKTVALDHYINAATFDFAHTDGKIFQMDTEGYLYKVDPTTGETRESSAAAAVFGAPVDDMEYAGLNSLNLGQDVLVGVYGGYFLYSIPAMVNTFSSGWNMASYLSTYLGASSFTAVAWAGYDSSGRDVFFCLTDSGDIWVMMINFTKGQAGMNYYETDLNLDFPGYDGAYYCSMVMGDDGNFYLSYFDGSTNQIYILEREDIYQGDTYCDTVYHATLLGDVGDAVWPAALLTVTSNNTDAADDADSNESLRQISLPGSMIEFTEKAQEITLPERKVNQPKGSLNAVQAKAETQRVEDSDAHTGSTAAWYDVLVQLTENETVTNGKYTVQYDPDILYFVGASSPLLKSCTDDGNGTVTFAFASKDNVETGDLLANLFFCYVDDENLPETTTITVAAQERNRNTSVNSDSVSITISTEKTENPCSHSWVSDPNKADQAPTCTEEGYQHLVCEDCGAAKTVTVPATGHSPMQINGRLICRSCGTVLTEKLPGSGSSNGDDFPFSDVDDEAIKPAIKYLYDNGIMDGVGGGKFDPYATLTRAMVVTILYRLDGKEAVTFAGAFSDVPSGQWYSDAVEWAAKHEIVNGMGDGTFAPNGKITREQLAAILQRYAQYKKLSTSVSTSLNASAQVSDWAKENVQWAVALNLLEGGKSVNAVAQANRAEVAVAIYNFIMELM